MLRDCPASGDSLYRIASLTKPITASAVLISEQAGRLSRSDKISRFLAFPEPAPTIDELIKHIPGLPNYLETPAFQNGRTSPTTVETLLSLIQPWDGVRRYQYSNSHAILSGAALQQVNGLRYEEVVQRDIFGPAGMSRSSFVLPPASESFPFPSSTHPSWVYAAGGVTSTAADMNRFNQALLSNLFGFGAVESFDRSAAGVTSFGMGSGGQQRRPSLHARWRPRHLQFIQHHVSRRSIERCRSLQLQQQQSRRSVQLRDGHQEHHARR